MMNAFAQSDFIEPGSVQESTFFWDVLINIMPGAIMADDVQIIRGWVENGCPPANRTFTATVSTPFRTQRLDRQYPRGKSRRAVFFQADSNRNGERALVSILENGLRISKSLTMPH